MDRIPQTPPVVKPLASTPDRPLWSVMIPVYDCSTYLIESLKSVLSQDLGAQQMQIEVVDDASTDADVEAIVQRIGQGRVNYFRQNQNVGSLRNFETCINRAKGQLVHLLHGDDRVLPGFYGKFTQLFQSFPDAGAAFCRYAYIDMQGEQHHQREPEIEYDGILTDWLPRIAQQNRLQYVSMVVKRSVYEQLGGFYGVTFGEDWEMWVRIARYYPVAYTPEVLAEYRCHDQSISDQKLTTGQALRDLRIVIDTIQYHLPKHYRERVHKKAKKHYLWYGMYGAYNAWKMSGNYSNMRKSIQEAFLLHSGLLFYVLLTKVGLKIFLHRCRFDKPRVTWITTKFLYLIGRDVSD
ncbi:glycosyltransferase family 2 protein [Spirosoma soli]|uniref:Glycosyltransferase family 2 protein n=1 Tax=Spirosoma soli TaxID=1770529 RepID=A0ABW5M9H5_9BACT